MVEQRFSNLLDELESRLTGEALYLGGQQPNKDDADAFNLLADAPESDTHPNAYSWYCLVGKFTNALRNNWQGGSGIQAAKAAAAPQGGKKAAQAAKPA